jgi:beta-galactosidase GanA
MGSKEPQTAEVLATYTKRFYSGKAAITKNRYGKGLMYYVGIDVDAKNDEFYRRIVSDALRDSGIMPGGTGTQWCGGRLSAEGWKEHIVCAELQRQAGLSGHGPEYLNLNALTGKMETQNVELAPYDVKVLTAPKLPVTLL